MVLSATAARTLEQVKSGLSILYGADYFTEDEWIKLDGLIHKGKYVFTRGPQTNILDQELMSFDDFQDTSLLATDEKDISRVTERHIPTPVSEQPSLNFSEPLPNEASAGTSAEASADEAYANETSIVKRTPALPPPSNGGLALYTQAQLDEVKAFNANLTRAGEKGSKAQKPRQNYASAIEHSFQAQPPNYASSVDQKLPSSAWPGEQEQIKENDSPTSAEQASRINSWASEVNAEDSHLPVSSPEPTNSKYSAAGLHAVDGIEGIPRAVEKFIQVQGRNPGSANDVFQPRIQGYRAPQRPDSRASTRTTKSVMPKVTRKLYATTGDILLAYSDVPKRSHITIEVKAGDSIQYIKPVSGIMHTGKNLRTEEYGQFPETVLEPTNAQQVLIPQQSSTLQNVYGRDRGMTFTSAASNGLDRVEAMNAAEWDRESEMSRPTTSTTDPMALAPVPMRANVGLAGSRFATLAEIASQDGDSDRGRGGVTQAELRKIIREELAQKPIPTQIRIKQSSSLTNIIPKTTTCWWWKTKRDCRFTDEECIHLHADVPDGGEPANLRMGKPTWGALADVTSPAASTITPTEVNPAIEFKLFSKSKTCYYWATDGKCNNTAVDCKYLHEYTAAGVAPKPNGYVSHKKDFNWSKVGRTGAVTEDPSSPTAQPSQTLQSTEYGWGTRQSNVVADVPAENTWASPNSSTAAIMANPNAAIWGAVEGSSAWDVDGDVYKPPHIKALEERERIDAVGW